MTFRRVLLPLFASICVVLYLTLRLVSGGGVDFLSWSDFWIVIASLVFGLFASVAPSILTGQKVPIASTAGWASLLSMVVLLVGLLTETAASSEAWYVAPIVGLLVGSLVFTVASLFWLIPLRPIYRLKKISSDPVALEAAIERIVEKLQAWNPQSRFQARRHAQVAMAAGTVLTEMRRWKDASRVLQCVNLDRIDPLRRSVIQASRAVAFLYQGDRRAAWDAVTDASRHCGGFPALLPALAINAELIASLDGSPETVLRKLDEIGRPKLPQFQRGWLLARANALAGQGEVEAARSCLTELAQIAPDGLDRAIDLKGPASALAREMKGASLGLNH